MDLSLNPLPDKQGKFLESVDGLLKENINKSQYRTDIVNHLDESIRYFHHILPNSKLLNKEKIYDKINALTLNDFLTNSLRDMEKPEHEKQFVYDFRTVEIARLLFETSKQYLEQNTKLKADGQLPSYINQSLQNISEFLKMLSNTVLDDESHDTIPDKEEKLLREKLHTIEIKCQTLEKDNKEYAKLVKQHNELSNKAGKLDQEYNIIVNKIEKMKNDDNPVKRAIQVERVFANQTKKELSKVNKETIPIQEKMKQIKKPLNDELTEIHDRLNEKYSHLNPYFCSLNMLNEFRLTYNPHKPKDNQIIGV